MAVSGSERDEAGCGERRALGRGFDTPATRIVESRLAVGCELDAPAVLVDERVVVRALCRAPDYAAYGGLLDGESGGYAA